MPISRECLDKAYHIYEAHEYAHAASTSALKKDKGSADRYLNLMRGQLEQADLPRETLEDLGKDIVEAAQWVEREKTEAVWALSRFLDKTKELMFETVVTCECSKMKGNPYPKQLTVPEKHQLKIAKDTLKMPDAMAKVMGGMTKEEAREIIRKLEGN